MILGVGVDIAQVDRFKAWTDYPEERLYKVYSPEELDACRKYNSHVLRPEKLATRFAAKEAFFKALSATLVRLKKTEHEFTFLQACHHVQVAKTTWNVPILIINWTWFEQRTGVTFDTIQVDLSLSDERNAVVAYVVLSQC